MTKQVQNQFGETALDFLISRIENDSDKLYDLICDNEIDRINERRYQMLQEFLEMIDEAKIDFEDSFKVDPDPMLDPQLG